jgi:hypothetical protein
MMTNKDSFRCYTTPHSLRDSSKAPSGHHLQGAEAAGASEEDMGISPEKSIAYSVPLSLHTRMCQITILKQKEIAEAKLGRIS